MKQPKPWFRASKSAWYVEHQFKQVRLGEHPDGAPPPKKSKAGWNPPPAILDAFYKLMAADPANLPRPDKITAALVCDLFLRHSEQHHGPDTFGNYRYRIVPGLGLGRPYLRDDRFRHEREQGPSRRTRNVRRCRSGRAPFTGSK